MTAVRAARVASVAGAEVLLVTRMDDVRWLTGFTGSTGWAIFDSATGHGVLMVDGRYAERALSEVKAAGSPFSVEVARTSDEHDSVLVQMLRDRPLGVDPAWVSAARMTSLRGLCNVAEERTPFDELRRCKDEGEIALMLDSASIADHALQMVVSDGLCGRTEREVRNRIEWLMRESGADEPGFATIVATGPNGARPHHEPSDDIIENGHAVVIDLGARVDGYRSDMTRTVLVGDVSEEVRTMFVAVLEAQAAGLAAVKAGVRGSDVDEACRRVFRESGTESEFVHGTGHGVGLAIHEYPILGPRCDALLMKSEVVTVEPGLYRVGSGGVRIEDLVVVEEHGHRCLTQSPKELTCLRSARTI